MMREEPQLPTYGPDPVLTFIQFVFLAILCLMVLGVIIHFIWAYREMKKGQKLPVLPEYKIIARWDAEEAGYIYTLQESNPYNTGYVDTDYCGDHRWAKTNAKHYKCEIVKEEDGDLSV